MSKPRGSFELFELVTRSPYLMALILASLLLSVASFYTTWVGITPFVEYTIFGAFITVGIQSLLLVTSWRLGFMLAGKEPVSIVEMIVFVVCLALSVAFSFNSLFNVIFVPELQQEASMTRVRDGASAAVNQVEQTLKARRDDQVKALMESEAYVRWRADVLAVADLAQERGGELRGMLDAQRRERELEVDGLARAARDLAARKGTLQDEIATMQQELATLEADRPGFAEAPVGLRAQVRGLDDAVIGKTAEMAAEEGGIGETGREGRGPKWAALKRQLDIIQAEKQLREDQLTTAQKRLEENDQAIRSLREEIRKTELLFANIDAEIEAARGRASEARERLGGSGNQDGPDSQVQALRDYPDQFEANADLINLKRAEGLCSQFFDNLKALSSPPPGLHAHACDRGPIMALVSPIGETMASLAALQRACTGADAASFHEMTAEAALAEARKCIDLSSLPFNLVRSERAELDRLQREEGPNASQFTKTTNALFAGEKLAIFALVIALVMDLLVLFTGLVGAKSATARVATSIYQIFPWDSHEAIAIKTLLNHVKPYSGKIEGRRYAGRIDLDRIPDPAQRDLLAPVLVQNTVVGMARQSTKEGESGVYYLLHGAHEQFEDRLERAQARAAEDEKSGDGAGPSGARPGAGGRGQGGAGAFRPYARGERRGPFRSMAGTEPAPHRGTQRQAAAPEPVVSADPVADAHASAPPFSPTLPASDSLDLQPTPATEIAAVSELAEQDDLVLRMLGGGRDAPGDRNPSLDGFDDRASASPQRAAGPVDLDAGPDPGPPAQGVDDALDDYDWIMGRQRKDGPRGPG